VAVTGFYSKVLHITVKPYYAVLLEIFILYSAVKKFWKSVKIWESYCQKFGGFLFWNTVYIDVFCILFITFVSTVVALHSLHRAAVSALLSLVLLIMLWEIACSTCAIVWANKIWRKEGICKI